VLTLPFLLHHENGNFSILMKDTLFAYSFNLTLFHQFLVKGDLVFSNPRMSSSLSVYLDIFVAVKLELFLTTSIWFKYAGS
jgi:hypothetical protein